MAQIRLEGVTKRFDDVVALEALDLEAGDDDFLVLLGQSGCGKSTALRCIAGETAGWQLRLDAALATLRDDAAASDSVAADTPAAEPAAARPSRAAALDRAQSAWLAWLAAECDWHRLGFDPETADVAAAECRRDAIADRVLRLGPRSAAVDGP